MGKVKAITGNPSVVSAMVSIPYGKGKDGDTGRSCRGHQVSIPYGKGKDVYTSVEKTEDVCINSLWERLRYCPRA